MAMSVGGGGEGQSYSEINMTPLIDVMLVLLIIFIITLPNQTHAVKIDGTLLWNKNPVDRKTLQGYIETEAQKDPQPEVHITVDKFAKYEIVAQTLADLQHRGLKKIGFVNNDFF
jgi:biopolymer transport protein ExbD